MSLENRERRRSIALQNEAEKDKRAVGGDKSVSDKLNVQRLELEGVETNENIKAVRWF